MSDIKSKLWSWIVKKFYVIPGVDKINASNAVVYTIDEDSAYLPLQTEEPVSIPVQLLWLLTYIVIWLLVILPKSTTYYSAYDPGFISGLIIILVESFYYITISSIDFTTNPIEPYNLNAPKIKPIKKGEKIKDINNFIDFSPGQGDYKILLNNKSLPKSENFGYILKANKFITGSVNGTFESINLEDFLRTTGNSDEKYRFNPTTQANIDYFSNRVNEEAWASFYIAIIIVTWAIYITTSKYGGRLQLPWTLLAFLITILSGSSVIFTPNILAYNYILYVRKRLLILAISFAITSIFIVDY